VKILLHPENNEVVSWVLFGYSVDIWGQWFAAETLATLNVLPSIVVGAIPGLLLINYQFFRRHTTQ